MVSGAGGQITYNPMAVSAVASDFNAQGAQLMEIHSDIKNQTDSLAEFFAGQGADGFFESQGMCLSGLFGLSHTVGKHGVVTDNVLAGAVGRDHSLKGLFNL